MLKRVNPGKETGRTVEGQPPVRPHAVADDAAAFVGVRQRLRDVLEPQQLVARVAADRQARRRRRRRRCRRPARRSRRATGQLGRRSLCVFRTPNIAQDESSRDVNNQLKAGRGRGQQPHWLSLHIRAFTTACLWHHNACIKAAEDVTHRGGDSGGGGCAGGWLWNIPGGRLSMVPFCPCSPMGGGGGRRTTGLTVGRLAVGRGLTVGRLTVGRGFTVGRLAVGFRLTVGRFFVGFRFAVGRFFVGFRFGVGRFFVGFRLVGEPPRLWQPNTLT